MYLTLKRTGIPAELHVYAARGHGFGVRPSDRPVSNWRERFADWLQEQGTLNGRAIVNAAIAAQYSHRRDVADSRQPSGSL